MTKISYVRGHNSEMYGRPDHRSKTLYVYADQHFLGMLRETPPAHTGMWYAMPQNHPGGMLDGPFKTREEATDELARAFARSTDSTATG